ncbi:hypothetical protein DIE16_31990 [Burkholderia sp. Bp9090]|nr:hypothetical protein DIE16_31990 [Burkholderia sp. Bp9090]
MCERITEELVKLYCLLQPGKSPKDFVAEVMNPIANSTIEEPAKIAVARRDGHLKLVTHYVDAIVQSCSYVALALRAEEDGNRDLGWSHAASAQYFLGRIEALLILEPALAHANTVRGKSGATKRDEKFGPLRALARDLAARRYYPSKRNAALSIKPEILAAAKVQNVVLSEMQAERTITGWLDGMPFGSEQ